MLVERWWCSLGHGNQGERSHGGWGGRHRNIGANQWDTAADDGDKKKPMWRWMPAVQNDWATRLDWCVKGYDEANHHPVAALKGSLDREVTPGELVTLDASSSRDPDGDELRFSWWQYCEAGTAESRIEISGANASRASFRVPEEPRRSLHILLEVTDDGEPPLTSYRRVIFDIV